MAIPYKHLISIEELDRKESLEMLSVIKLGISATRTVLKPDEFNIGPI